MNVFVKKITMILKLYICVLIVITLAILAMSRHFLNIFLNISGHYCKSCKDGRTLFVNNCLCEKHYYDDGESSDCRECHFKCANCYRYLYNKIKNI